MSIPIVVSLDAAHSMIAFPVEAPVFHVRGEHGVTGTDGAPREALVYEEWGYAERAWYLEKRQGFTGVLRALLWPTEGVVEVGIYESIWAACTAVDSGCSDHLHWARSALRKLQCAHARGRLSTRCLVHCGTGTGFRSGAGTSHTAVMRLTSGSNIRPAAAAIVLNGRMSG